MFLVKLDPTAKKPLVNQLVDDIQRQIDRRRILPGTRVPSIRKLAETCGISRFSAVEAYDRLVALGVLEVRRGSGFYVAGRRALPAGTEHSESRRNEELSWLMRRLLGPAKGVLLASGVLPIAWMNQSEIRQIVARVARRDGAHLIEFGEPFGYLPLREHLCLMLAELDVTARPSQILLTHSASHALELLVKRYVGPGHSVLVDDPGYYNLFASLRLHGARLLAVPRTPHGPDLSVLEDLTKEHCPRFYFTQSVLHNPTGTDMSAHTAFRLLQLAEKYDFRIIEDDVFCDLQTKPTPRLASLDQLERVIYVRSFSKTLSGSLRVGFVAARQSIVDELADVKLLSSISSSVFVERVVYSILTEGYYRKLLSRIHEGLDDARRCVVQEFERQDIEIFGRPDSGMYLWARFAGVEDAFALANSPASNGVILAPGVVFSPHGNASPWMRFNVTTTNNPKVFRWLECQTLRSG